ncbi:hypothetical protein [uncultured Jatrophihabitans sp.]|uniref:hypothetical protein n=1 Tax=uncultured Jatrophihabitans sp. TaxID=1610747 RepID=UPI0035CBECFF
MAGFGVDTDALHQFGDQIAAICRDLGDLLTGSPPNTAETGHGDLAHALDLFHLHWSTQESSLIESLMNVRKVVHDALATYLKAEGLVTGAADGSTS